MKRVLITGAAGFIGSQLMARLKERDGLVVKGIDNFNSTCIVHLQSCSQKHFDLDIWGCDLCDEVKTDTHSRVSTGHDSPLGVRQVCAIVG